MRAALQALASRLGGWRRRAGSTWWRGRLQADPPVDAMSLPACRFEHFPAGAPTPWLDADDAEEAIERRLRAGELTLVQAEQCRAWRRDGFIVLRQLIDDATLDTLWAAYEEAIARRRIHLPPEQHGPDDVYPGRSLNPHQLVPQVAGVMQHERVLEWIGVLMGYAPRPFQSILSHKGSQQLEHSDSIHMTTYPLGYLTAIWVAFEDIHPDAGPLMVYPGSHRLPYLFSRDVGIRVDDFRQSGYRGYLERYEPRIQALIREHRLKGEPFLAKKGDVLIWHANLIHGGSLRRDLRWSRRALVCHYFVDGVVAYHDLAAAPCSTRPLQPSRGPYQ